MTLEDKKLAEFADLVVTLIKDDEAHRRFTKHNLSVIEGVLSALLATVTKELARRDAEKSS